MALPRHDPKELTTAMMRRAYTVPALLLAMAYATQADGPSPEVTQWLGNAPDRGNQQYSAYVTGPASAIKGFANDDLEISLWQGPSPLVFSLAKNDVWDRRYFGGRKEIVDIDAIREMCFGGVIPAPNGPTFPTSPQALYLAYDYPCPKPVGQLILRAPDLGGAGEWRVGSTRHSAAVIEASNDAARADLFSFLCRTQNVLVVEGAYSGLTQPLSIELFRHQDTTPEGTSIMGLAHYGGDTGYDYTADPDNGPLAPPEAGQDGRFFWVRQVFPAEPTFPEGFESVMVGLIDGAAPSLDAQNGVANAGVPATVHPIDDEAYQRMPGYLKEVRIETQRVNESPSGCLASATLPAGDLDFTLYLTVVTTRDSDDPLKMAREQLTEAAAQGADELALRSAMATTDDLRAWRNTRVMHYNATSCSYMDSTPWHGDYHFNEGAFLQDIISGNASDLEPRLRMFEEMLPALKRNAREVYHCDGAAFSLVHYPITADRVVYSNFTWEWGVENTAFMLQPFWQIYQYTQDMDFLRERAYPMMVEGARFYADYVTLGDDGRYHVIPTVSQEHWGFTPEWRLNRDSVGALSFVKYHLKACIEASTLLGVDEEERARWREIVDSLAPYPTLDTPEGRVFCDVADAPEILDYNITANLAMSLWAEDISLDSPPEQLEMARRSYAAIPNKEGSMRPGYLQAIAMYLGMPGGADLSPVGRVLSWPGRIHLWAGVPEGTEVDDAFSGLLAVGGFEVSARRKGAEVSRVRILSLAGNTCKVKSPWGLADALVMDFAGRATVPHVLDGDTIVFDTEPGHTYALLAGEERALADLTYTPDEQLIGRWDSSADLAAGEARLVGDAAISDVDGEDALVLSGDSAYLEIARTPSFDFAANEGFEVMARFRLPRELPPRMIPLVCSMDLKQYCLMLNDGKAHFYLSSPGGDVYSSVTGERVLTDGAWHTIRGVRDVVDGMIRVYVDGELEGSAPDSTQGDFASAVPITIGAYLWGENSRYTRGAIAEAEVRRLGRLEPRGM